MNRRHALQLLAAAPLASTLRAAEPPFRLRHVLSSALFGEMDLASILPEIAATGCDSIDIWRRVHGNQREQIQAMGDEAFAALLAKHRARLGVSTCYPLGPFGLAAEIAWVKKFGGEIVLTGSGKNGAPQPEGAEAKRQVADFLEKMKPHVAVAEEHGITIALENHANDLLYHPDSLRAFAELNRSPRLGIAFAPHHLHRFPDQIPALIRDLGRANLPFIYFQEHCEGMLKKSPKEEEMRQLPGFGGSLDYASLIGALKGAGFTGLVEIFMHPVPRGVPILPTIPEIRFALLKSHAFIDACLAKANGRDP